MKIAYKLITIFVYRWLTTASGYLWLLIFHYDSLTMIQKDNVLRVASFILSIYAPMFLRIHFSPRGPEGPGKFYFVGNCCWHFGFWRRTNKWCGQGPLYTPCQNLAWWAKFSSKHICWVLPLLPRWLKESEPNSAINNSNWNNVVGENAN